MNKSELRQLIREVIGGDIDDLKVLRDPHLKPYLDKLRNGTINDQLADEDDINDLAVAAYRLGKANQESLRRVARLKW
jgi:hypothetical protein